MISWSTMDLASLPNLWVNQRETTIKVRFFSKLTKKTHDAHPSQLTNTCLKLTLKTSEWRQWVVLVLWRWGDVRSSLLLILIIFRIWSYFDHITCFYRWLYTGIYFMRIVLVSLRSTLRNCQVLQLITYVSRCSRPQCVL